MRPQRNRIAAITLLVAYLAPVVPVSALDSCTALLRIDPRAASTMVQGQFGMSGSAIDPNVTSGSGISSVEIYLDGTQEPGAMARGPATWEARPDIGEVLGRTATSGYQYTSPGTIYASYTSCMAG